MSETILFIFMHGYKGTANSLFIPLLREKLQAKGYESSSIDYPHADNPVYSEWKSTFLKLIQSVWKGQKIVLCGHSLGGYTVLRLVGECADEAWAKNVIGVITVGGVTKTGRRLEYYDKEIPWDRIKQLAPRVINVHSDDDPYVPLDHQDYEMEKLAGIPHLEKKTCTGFAHFQMKEAEPVTEAVMSFVK